MASKASSPSSIPPLRRSPGAGGFPGQGLGPGLAGMRLPEQAGPHRQADHQGSQAGMEQARVTASRRPSSLAKAGQAEVTH